MALFKTVLSAWGEIVGQEISVAISLVALLKSPFLKKRLRVPRHTPHWIPLDRNEHMKTVQLYSCRHDWHDTSCCAVCHGDYDSCGRGGASEMSIKPPWLAAGALRVPTFAHVDRSISLNP
jgi:hypothetical protein